MSKKHVPAPKFFLVIRIPAWTDEQAERLEKEVRDKFTAHDVTKEENTAPEPVAAEVAQAMGAAAAAPETAAAAAAVPTVPKKFVEEFVGQLLADGVSETKLVHALGVFVTPKKPAAAAAAVEEKKGPAPKYPFAMGDTLADKYVENRIVIVATVDQDGWVWTDAHGATGSNLWADAEHYKKVSEKEAEKLAKEELSSSAPAAQTTGDGSAPAGEAAGQSAAAETKHEPKHATHTHAHHKKH